ncbi:hypothetical protein KEM48_011934 [Puccinia striiformis f. sp. tritici PST-130]|nr:hypothetical protein KEM48_011934 [Puccinia striiformis f. sp. tritici PST-130]
MTVESRQNGQVKRHVGQGADIQTAILAISHAVAGQHHGPHGCEPTNLASHGSEPTNLASHGSEPTYLAIHGKHGQPPPAGLQRIEIVESSSQAPYELAKRKRVSAFTPKQPKKPNAFKPSPAAASKRTVPNTSIPVQCGFHVQVKGRFVSEFSRHPKAQFIESNNPNSHNKLLAELRDKFKGHDLGLYGPFSKTHYPFTHLGTKKSGSDNRKSFMAHLDAHKTNQIDLILDYDDYAKSCAQGEEDESDTSSSDEET